MSAPLIELGMHPSCFPDGRCSDMTPACSSAGRATADACPCRPSRPAPPRPSLLDEAANVSASAIGMLPPMRLVGGVQPRQVWWRSQLRASWQFWSLRAAIWSSSVECIVGTDAGMACGYGLIQRPTWAKARSFDRRNTVWQAGAVVPRQVVPASCRRSCPSRRWPRIRPDRSLPVPYRHHAAIAAYVVRCRAASSRSSPAIPPPRG